MALGWTETSVRGHSLSSTFHPKHSTQQPAALASLSATEHLIKQCFVASADKPKNKMLCVQRRDSPSLLSKTEPWAIDLKCVVEVKKSKESEFLHMYF